ncbi:VanZ family protein [Corynebacterium timonense]|uniref:VanZ family protein n=1 Tax=Corynebacterium timonense TaxID=441500 RepID=UPI00155FE76F|nr:VanZ family protein [Corynebacterium timonense]
MRNTIPAWVLVLAAVFCITVGKAYVDGPLWNASVQSLREIRLIPLQEFYQPTVWYGPWLNFLGNVALFVPVGLLARRRAVPVGVGLSVAIELTQFATATGYTDIDDLIFNTLGAALGGWLAGRLTRRSYRAAVAACVAGSLAVVAAFAGLWLVQ